MRVLSCGWLICVILRGREASSEAVVIARDEQRSSYREPELRPCGMWLEARYIRSYGGILMETTTEGLINDLVTKIFEELSGLEVVQAPQDDDGLFDTVDHAVEQPWRPRRS